MDYLGMMREALLFIEENLKEDIRPEDVSAKAFFSLPHLYRIFRATLGCSIKEYVRRRRLSLAAEALLSTKAKVIDIALDLGYGSPETFLRAFKAEYGRAPLAFRKTASMAPLFPAAELRDRGDRGEGGGQEPRIVFHKDMPLSCVSLRTSLAQGKNLRDIPAFWDRLAREGFLSPEIRGETAYGLYTEWAGEDDFTLAVGRAAPGNSNFSVPASRYAVFSLEPFDASEAVGLWDYIYGDWFPRTGCERTGRLVDFERYTKDF
jgi:AraC family transcriptional regulator